VLGHRGSGVKIGRHSHRNEREDISRDEILRLTAPK